MFFILLLTRKADCNLRLDFIGWLVILYQTRSLLGRANIFCVGSVKLCLRNIMTKLELEQHITYTLGEPLLNSHSHSSSVLQRFSLSGLPMAIVVLFQSDFQGQVVK